MDAEKAAVICDKVAGGASLRAACRDVGITHPAFLQWCDADTELANRYTRARASGADIDFEDLQEAINMEPQIVDGKVDHGWVAWRRLQIDTKKWALSKKAPKRYGDKIEHEHTGGLSVTLMPTDKDL